MVLSAKRVHVLLVGLLVLSASAIAADNGNKKPRNSAPTTRPAQRAAVKTIKGQIIHVDVEAKSLKIEVKDKQQTLEVDVTTDEKTEVILDGAAVTLADLRPGMSVRITPDTGTATRIIAKSDPKKQKNEKKQNGNQPGTPAA